jgi:protein-tyrosine phosphatase
MTGYPADAEATEAARRQGVELDGHIARMLTPTLGAEHDLILVMERSHRREIAERFPQLVGRTMLYGQWLDGGTDVPDPYRKPALVHEQTVSLILRASAAWVSRLGGKAG